MQTLTPLDWGILAILVISVVTAFLHGFLVEVCALAGLVAGIVLAGRYYLQIVPWVHHFVHQDAAAAAIALRPSSGRMPAWASTPSNSATSRW